MRDDLLLYYERELTFLRQMGAEFAAKYPKVASRLVMEPDKCEDPHVERILEAFAFLTARVHLKIDDEFPEITEALLNILHPHYLRPIPSMTVAEFLRACKMASIFARDGSGIVRLIMTPGGELVPGKITVSSKSEELGEDIGEIDAIVQGNDAKIAFNGKYLTDVLNVLKEAQVSLETSSPSSPGVIRPVGSDAYVHVVMPVKTTS